MSHNWYLCRSLKNDVSALGSVIGKLLNMSGTIWVYESIFSTGNFMKSKQRRSISNENLIIQINVKIHTKLQAVQKKSKITQK